MEGIRKNEAQKCNRKRKKYPQHKMTLRSNKAFCVENCRSSENSSCNEEANTSYSKELRIIHHKGATLSETPDVHKEKTKIKEMAFLINKEIDERSKNEHHLKEKIKCEKKLCSLDKPICDKFYRQGVVNEEIVEVGNFVSFKTEVGKIKYFFDKDSRLMAHVQLYWPSSRTILGDLGNKKEIFLLNLCQNIDISTIEKVLKVHEIDLADDFKANNNNNNNKYNGEFDFYNKLRYNIGSGKFDYPLPETVLQKNSLGYCQSCKTVNNEMKKKEIQVGYNNICNTATKKYFENVFRDNQEYRVGNCVYFIEYEDYKYGFEGAGNKDTRSQSFESPHNEHVLSKNRSKLFSIGLMEHIFFDETDQEFRAHVKRFYRNEDVPVKPSKTGTNIHLLYASEEEVTINFSDIKGICYVVFTKNICGNIKEWLDNGPDRFHFTEQLDKFGNISSDINEIFKALRDDSDFENGPHVSVPPSWPEIRSQLNTLDVFSGAGGLSLGLQESGVSFVQWAVEYDSPACMSFAANNPYCVVINRDLNEVLKRKHDLKDGKALVNLGFPEKHEVHMICGGPPCQGFSLLNMHREGEETEKKNELSGLMFILVNYYRPRFVVFENVPTFFSLKEGYYFKQALQSLIKIGYQVNFGVLEAGCFGVPQIRKRAFLIAAAPGEILPDFPKALHAIDKARMWQKIDLDNKKYVLESSKCMTEFAPLRPYHVKDAISDLKNYDTNTEKAQQYKLKPQTCYQEKMRRWQHVLTDHVWDIPNDSLNQIKIDSIPINECEEDSRETASFTNICSTTDWSLDNENSGGDSSEPNITKMQDVESANGNHQWSSICSRLQWDGYFETITTNVSHTCLQGSYIHPDENRLISLREVARAQGFPDSHVFHGAIKDIKKQLGNAVPPPLAYAIGQEIKLSMARYEQRDYLQNKNSYFYSRF